MQIMMTRQEVGAIYDAGKQAVVHALLELDAQIQSLEKQVRDLNDRLEQSESQVRDMEGKLAKNSRNSSKPPSSDGFKKPKPKSLRKEGVRKSGGQPGHTGHTLKMAGNPDQTVMHRVQSCACCGRSLADQSAAGVERRQVHDLPPLRLIVTEHQAETKMCPCGQLNKAAFPDGVSAPVQYGEGIKAAAAYLKQYQLLPYERTCELLGDFFDCPMSEGTLANIIAQSHDLVVEPLKYIRQHIEQAPVAHFDETGARVEGKRWWMHSASTADATYYDIHRKRGNEATDQIGILPNYSGRAIHDFWKPYFVYPCLHGLCNAHHLRELIFVHEQLEQDWAERMIACLLDIKSTVTLARTSAGQLDAKQIHDFEELYREILEQGYAQNPLPAPHPDEKKKKGSRKKTKARNLLERLDGHRSEVLAFMYDLNVPFDNNQAERDLRMTKVQQKISGSFRSEEGAKAFCRIRSYISTARKNAVGAMDALTRLFTGKPFELSFNSS